jgi:hypothetical protein
MEPHEFKALFQSLMSMPEAENPALYKRFQHYKERTHAAIQWQMREEKPFYPFFVGVDIPPEECRLCTPEELCLGHELFALCKEREKSK